MRARFTRRSSSSPTRVETAHGYRVFTLLGSIAILAVIAVISESTGRSLSHVNWYITRSSGFTLYLLLWLVVMLGLGLTTGLLDRFGGRGVVFSLHRFATDLSYGVLALHMGALVFHDWIRFDLRDLLIPFASGLREPWTGIGVIAAWLFVLIGVSFGLQRWIGQRGWRVLHYASFPLFVIALAHGLGAGSDTVSLWAQGLYALTLVPVVFLTFYRLLRPGVRTSAPIRPARRAG